MKISRLDDGRCQCTWRCFSTLIAALLIGCGPTSDPQDTADCDAADSISWGGETLTEALSDEDPDECLPSLDYSDSQYPTVPGTGHSVVLVGVEWAVDGNENNATLTIGIGDEDGPDVEAGTYSLVIPGGGVSAEASMTVSRLTPDMGA